MNKLPVEFNKNGRFMYKDVESENNCEFKNTHNKHDWSGGADKCNSCGKWAKWKNWTELNDQEKAEVNLGQYASKYILLDFDFKNKTEAQIMEAYNEWVRIYPGSGRYTKFIADRSPHGFHIYLPFSNLDSLEPEVQNEIRKQYVKFFKADEAKISINGIVSLPGRPHFKTKRVMPILEECSEYNELTTDEINTAITRVKENNERLQNMNKDMVFEDYFEKDPFFKYCSENVIPDGTGRDINIFPNLAIGCVKSGKSLTDIKRIMLPIIQKNFPGKTYQEFEGWIKKAVKGQITTYNKYQINNWMKDCSPTKTEMYDMSPVIIKPEQVQQANKIDVNRKKTILTDQELHDSEDANIDWLIENWLAAGDINFIAGKAASYKTTAVLHMAYCIASGNKVFQEYETKKVPVLYLNEENSRPIFKKMVNRIKKGLELEEGVDGIYHSILENWQLDTLNEAEKTGDLFDLIEFINEKGIKLLICDSFRRFFQFEENSATDISKLFNNLKYLREACPGLTIVILHHMKKSQQGSPGDLRDAMRGSSDIVNSADSVIGISRRHNQEVFKISHIKNRAGQEMTEKIIMVKSGDNDDMAHLYQSDAIAGVEKTAAHDVLANQIVTHLEDNKISTFKRSELGNIVESNPTATVTRALKVLVEEGTLISSGYGKSLIYTFNQIENPEAVDLIRSESSENEENEESTETSNTQKTL